MRRAALLVVSAALLAGCGSSSDEGATGPAAGDGNGTAASNPRVAAVLDCLQGEGLTEAYQLEKNAIDVSTELNALEIYFLRSEAAAKERERVIAETGIGVIFRTGTVVEAWTTDPTADEREPVTKCIGEDPGP